MSRKMILLFLAAAAAIAHATTYSVGGRVCVDANMDGVCQAGETNAQGWQIIFAPGGTVTSGSDGHYQMSLANGDYLIDITPQDPFAITSDVEYSVTVSGGNSLGHDFCVVPLHGIYGTACLDTNVNGLCNSGEEGIVNMDTMLMKNSEPLAYDVTYAGGNYSFMYLLDGTYTVIMIPPEHYACEGDCSVVVQLAGADVHNKNFAMIGTFDVTGKVCSDTDRDGDCDVGEVGSEGWNVTLASGGIVVQWALTDSSGAYSFVAAAGAYVIATVPLQGWGVTGSVTIALQLTSAGSTGNNFAVATVYTIDGIVCLDIDRDAMCESPTDVGIANVTVRLFEGQVQLAITHTSAAGIYAFDILLPGTYSISVGSEIAGEPDLRVNPLADTTITIAVNAQGMNGNELVVVVADGNSGSNDFPFVHVYDLGGVLCIDVNRNDACGDVGDTALQSATVSLYTSDWLTLLGSTLTSSQGQYVFPRCYADMTFGVVVDTATGPFLLPVGVHLVPESPVNIDVTVPSYNTYNNNFMFVNKYAISGKVCRDYAADGTCGTGDTGVANAPMRLLQSGTLLATAASDSQGAYSFVHLLPGTYTVSVNISGGVFLTSNGDHLHATSATMATPTITGDDAPNVNFAFVDKFSISGITCIDADKNGACNTGEPPLTGTSVVLRDSSNTVLSTATTSSTGAYTFTGRVAATYSVAVSRTSGCLNSADGLRIGAAVPSNVTLALSADSTGDNFAPPLKYSNLTGLPGTGRTVAYWKRQMGLPSAQTAMRAYLTAVNSLGLAPPYPYTFLPSSNATAIALQMLSGTSTTPVARLQRELLALELNHVGNYGLTNLHTYQFWLIEDCEFAYYNSGQYTDAQLLELVTACVVINSTSGV